MGDYPHGRQPLHLLPEQSIYNNANLSTVVARDPASGKMLFFVVENPVMPSDATIFATIESNGGLNNIICVKMWANFATSYYSQGYWGFMSPCTDANGDYTTSISDQPSCNQFVTRGSPVGDSINAAGSANARTCDHAHESTPNATDCDAASDETDAAPTTDVTLEIVAAAT